VVRSIKKLGKTAGMAEAAQLEASSNKSVTIAMGNLRFFIAGIMQGSLAQSGLHPQEYRDEILEALRDCFPDAEIYDPLAAHRDSLRYDGKTGRQVFFGHNFQCRHVDVLVAYLPEASMGTAIEMWEAYRHGTVVVTISPMRKNWVVRFLSHIVFADLREFVEAARSGELARVIRTSMIGERKSGESVAQSAKQEA